MDYLVTAKKSHINIFKDMEKWPFWHSDKSKIQELGTLYIRYDVIWVKCFHMFLCKEK